jgi:hypothetical protein
LEESAKGLELGVDMMGKGRRRAAREGGEAARLGFRVGGVRRAGERGGARLGFRI